MYACVFRDATLPPRSTSGLSGLSPENTARTRSRWLIDMLAPSHDLASSVPGDATVRERRAGGAPLHREPAVARARPSLFLRRAGVIPAGVAWRCVEPYQLCFGR